MKNHISYNQDDESQSFNCRIEERVRAGFIPDVRRAVKCNYFYKSFWRDPHFINLYLGRCINIILELLMRYGKPGMRILDVGCGAGYITLELARAGFHMTGIDISSSAIKSAIQCKEENSFKDGFGSLEYHVKTLEDIRESFDCIYFSAVLHHLPDPEQTIKNSLKLLPQGGLVLAHEPLHDAWEKQDAAQIALMRCLLSLTGNYHESSLGEDILKGNLSFDTYVGDVLIEYQTERDKNELGGQSPHDNISSGTDILQYLQKHVDILEHRPSAAFIYRMLGGLRGIDEKIYPIADFLALYDDFALNNKLIKPNGFFFIGRKAE